jgi:alpha-L-rhamnosidase
MSEMADATGKAKEAADYAAMAAMAHAAFQRTLFDPAKGGYRDGEGTDHMSQHASLFPLAFSLVPEEQIQAVVKGVQKHGMACSVYAAQYLMEGLFANQAGTRALELITAPTDRSWRHMVESGTTITWEAWDMKYKPNQDWNHAWGAAPANLLPRFILGKDHHRRRPRNGEARRVTLDRG